MELVGARGAACTSRHAHIYSENTSMLVAGQDSEATTSHCHKDSLIYAHIHHHLARPRSCVPMLRHCPSLVPRHQLRVTAGRGIPIAMHVDVAVVP